MVTAPGPPALIPGGRYAPAFAVGVAVAKYADHLPLERQVRMMAREGLVVDSQTLWDQLHALARHLEPTYEALGQRALAAPVINVDETRWPRLGGTRRPPAPCGACTRRPSRSIASCPASPRTKDANFSAATVAIVVVDGYAVYEVLARDGPDFTLAHCWAHTKRKYDEIADALADRVCGDPHAASASSTRSSGWCRGRFPATPRRRRNGISCVRSDRARSSISIWAWATVQVGLPRSDFGKAVRYMLERWTGLTRFVDDPRIPLDNNADRTSLARAGRRPEESLRVEVAARHAGRRPLLHAL